MAESTASSVTKNRIKTNYHGALEGFASHISHIMSFATQHLTYQIIQTIQAIYTSLIH